MRRFGSEGTKKEATRSTLPPVRGSYAIRFLWIITRCIARVHERVYRHLKLNFSVISRIVSGKRGKRSRKEDRIKLRTLPPLPPFLRNVKWYRDFCPKWRNARNSAISFHIIKNCGIWGTLYRNAEIVSFIFSQLNAVSFKFYSACFHFTA